MLKHLEEYVDFSVKINDYISAMMIENEISYDTYDYSLVWNLVKSQGVTIREFQFKDGASEGISGLFVQDQLEATIGFNQEMDDKSKKFVISHEIIHYLFHNDEENSIFIDTSKNLQLSYHKELHEFQANIGASAILLPDGVLVYFLKRGWNLSQLSNYFGLTEEALYIRVMQTMQAYLGLSFKSANKYANDICYNFNKNGRAAASQLVAKLECQSEKKLVQIF